MIKQFFKDSESNLEYLGTLCWEKPQDEERELISIECTEDQIRKLEFWYIPRLINWELILLETEEGKNLLDTEYQRLREEEYPKVWDQLDAIRKWWQYFEDMKAKVMSVKAKYPKPNL